jgi:undecaprenyl-diphosphatase
VIYLLNFRWEALVGLLSASLAFVVDTAIKIFIHRPRPAADLVNVFQHLYDYSFPSGHVMLYTSFFGFMLFLVYTLLKRSLLRRFLLVLFGIPIVLVGPSRVYLGEHWASDVLGAYLLGSLVLWAVIGIYRWGKPKFFQREDETLKA